jgi:bifunctional non-homologous end joining protein LigD
MPQKIEVTHPDRVVFPADGITKGELFDYYTRIARVMVPHLKGRPLNLWRYPRGIGQKGFVQQDFSDSLPDWMSRAEVAKEGGSVVHPTADSRAALQWLANQNCVTVHAWLSRCERLHHPDRIVFDLDPSSSDFPVVKATARVVADVLGDLGLVPYVQTTGSRGLHVVTPIKADYDYDAARQFAREVAEVVVADDPARRTVEMRKANRGERVYLDVMRNAYAQTAVAPYSVRARPGAPVATPMEWDELSRRGLRANLFTIRDVDRRVAERGDPWADIARRARSLTAPIRRLAKMNTAGPRAGN